MGILGTLEAPAAVRGWVKQYAERVWIWSIVTFTLLRLVVAWGTFGPHGTNPWIFGVIDVATAWPYAKAVAQLCIRSARGDWSRLTGPIFVAAVSFFAPYCYIWYSAGDMPAAPKLALASFVTIVAIAAVIGIVRNTSRLREDLNAGDTHTDGTYTGNTHTHDLEMARSADRGEPRFDRVPEASDEVRRRVPQVQRLEIVDSEGVPIDSTLSSADRRQATKAARRSETFSLAVPSSDRVIIGSCNHPDIALCRGMQAAIYRVHGYIDDDKNVDEHGAIADKWTPYALHFGIIRDGSPLAHARVIPPNPVGLQVLDYFDVADQLDGTEWEFSGLAVALGADADAAPAIYRQVMSWCTTYNVDRLVLVVEQWFVDALTEYLGAVIYPLGEAASVYGTANVPTVLDIPRSRANRSKRSRQYFFEAPEPADWEPQLELWADQLAITSA